MESPVGEGSQSAMSGNSKLKSCQAPVILTPLSRKNSQSNLLTGETVRDLGKDHSRGDHLHGLIGAKWQAWQKSGQGLSLLDKSGLFPKGFF